MELLVFSNEAEEHVLPQAAVLHVGALLGSVLLVDLLLLVELEELAQLHKPHQVLFEFGHR